MDLEYYLRKILCNSRVSRRDADRHETRRDKLKLIFPTSLSKLSKLARYAAE